MAPLPSNNTGVLYIDYSVAGENHTQQVRFGVSSSSGDALALAYDLWAEASPLLFLCTIIGARVRDAGTNVTYPVTWAGAATYGSGAGEHFNSAWYMDFVGRSIDGRRCRISWFGLVVDFDAVNDDYRLLAGENSNVADVLTALDSGSDVPVSISGQAVNWHQYANIGQNAYWRNHIRG